MSDELGFFMGEPADGFMFSKEARLADWRFEKERREFAKVVNRLRVRKWQTEALADAVRAEKLRARKAEYARRPEVRERALRLARGRRVGPRQALLRTVMVCHECGAEWTGVPWLRRFYPRDFCDNRCEQRARYARKAARRAA